MQMPGMQILRHKQILMNVKVVPTVELIVHRHKVMVALVHRRTYKFLDSGMNNNKEHLLNYLLNQTVQVFE